MPSAKYSCSGSPLMLWNGRTAIEGLSGSASAAVSDKTDEAIAATRHGHQVALPAAVLVERLPQRRNLDLEVVLLDRQSRPDPRQQLVLGDHIALGGCESRRHVQRTAPQPHRSPVTPELAPPGVEPKSAPNLPLRRSSSAARRQCGFRILSVPETKTLRGYPPMVQHCSPARSLARDVRDEACVVRVERRRRTNVSVIAEDAARSMPPSSLAPTSLVDVHPTLLRWCSTAALVVGLPALFVNPAGRDGDEWRN